MGAVMMRMVPVVKKVRAVHITAAGRILPRRWPVAIAAMAPEMHTGEICLFVVSLDWLDGVADERDG